MVATQISLQEINDLRKAESTIYLKNNTGGTVTCNQGDISITLGPVGSSSSISPVTSDALGVGGIQRMLLNGKLTASSSADFGNEYAEQIDKAAQERKDSLDQYKMNIEEPPTNNDLVVTKCLISGKTVTQTQKQFQAQEPPLAPEYKHLSGEFIPTPISKDGKMEVTFQRRGH